MAIFLAARFGHSFESVAKHEKVYFDLADIYSRSKIALLTGWTFEYIDELGLVDRETILQVYEAEQKITASSSAKGKAKKKRVR